MQKSNLKLDSRVAQEKGAFIVLAALVLTVLFGMIAIAIDSTRAMTAKYEKIATADTVALASLDAYLNQEPQPSTSNPTTTPTMLERHHYKWNAVKSKVVTYINSNPTNFIDTDQTISLADINLAGKGITVKPGRWWLERPETCPQSGGPSCPCSEITEPLYRPCFQECDPATGCQNPGSAVGVGDIFANAMEVKLSTEGQGGLLTLFGGVLGINKIDVSGGSYSAMAGSVSHSLPQIGVLLFDLSRAMTIDSYLPFEKNPSNPNNNNWAARREYSFPLAAAPASGCSAAGVNSTCRINCPILAAPDLSYANEYQSAVYNNGIYDLYKCYSGTLGANLERHLVATRPGSLIPEPYSTLLTALNRYLVQFKTLARAGDKLMILGFDSVDLPELHFPRANANGAVFLAPDDPQLDALIAMTASIDAAAQSMFFPRARSQLDLQLALRTAANQILTSYPNAKIDPYIALFSNGLSLCGTRNPPGFVGQCASLLDPQADPLLQTLNYNKQIESLDEALVNVGENILRPNRIKVHVITGDSSVPPGASVIPAHSALMGHWQQNVCATDLEFRKAKYLYVVPYPEMAAMPQQQFQSMGTRPASHLLGVHYVQPTMYLYSLAATTLGTYFPIRPECTTLTAGDVNARCATNKLDLSAPPTTSTRVNRTRSGTYKPDPIQASAAERAEIDPDGRLLCEPRNGQASNIDNRFIKLATDLTQSRSIVLVAP